MTLLNEAYLVITSPESSGNVGGTAVFQFQSTQTLGSTVEKAYLAGGRGQYVSEINRLLGDPAEFDVDMNAENRRTGRWLDGGAGEWGGTLTFETGVESRPIDWGDGSGGTGQENVTPTDASGADVKPLSRMQVLSYWVANSASDSFGRTELHIGEWTDGRYGGSDGGAYGQPLPIAIQSLQSEKPEDNPAAFSGTLEYAQVTPFSEFEEGVADWIGSIASGDDPDYVPDE